jgi:hypothetical protein
MDHRWTIDGPWSLTIVASCPGWAVHAMALANTSCPVKRHALCIVRVTRGIRARRGCGTTAHTWPNLVGERHVVIHFARPWKAPRPPWRPAAAALEESPRLRRSIWRHGVSPAFLLIDDSFIRWHKYWCPYQCLWSGGVATLICTFCRKVQASLGKTYWVSAVKTAFLWSVTHTLRRKASLASSSLFSGFGVAVA